MSSELRRLVKGVVRILNEKVNLGVYKEKYSPGEDRTLLLIISSPRGQYGFAMMSNRVVVMDELDREPTVIIKTDEKTVWAIAARKMDLGYAVATRRVTFAGEYALRDYIILRSIFEEIREEVGI